jgi:dCMP deaminase
LRSADDLIQGIDGPAYSTYERNDKRFRDAMTRKFGCACNSPELNGRNLSFCFKDIQNEIEDEKNQVHTRSLHAEENAFLQISKHGGTSLSGGILFTTASPCELCAKKAYQLGLSRIIYIDPYPGIATNHVLASGDRAPSLELFRGAIGRAFHRLYQPVMPYKDELDLLLGLPKATNNEAETASALKVENMALKDEVARLTALLLQASNSTPAITVGPDAG